MVLPQFTASDLVSSNIFCACCFSLNIVFLVYLIGCCKSRKGDSWDPINRLKSSPFCAHSYTGLVLANTDTCSCLFLDLKPSQFVLILMKTYDWDNTVTFCFKTGHIVTNTIIFFVSTCHFFLVSTETFLCVPSNAGL